MDQNTNHGYLSVYRAKAFQFPSPTYKPLLIVEMRG